MAGITLNRLVFDFFSEDGFSVFPGPMLRGCLGLFLKRVLPEPKYRAIFETPTDSKIMKLYSYAPKGFAIKAPWQGGNRCRVEVRVFRNDEEVFSAIRDAFMYFAGQKGLLCRFVELRREKFSFSSGGEDCEGRLRVKFVTPTAIKYRGRFWREPEFHILVRNLLRRIFLIGHFHCGVDLEFDFRGLIARAEGVRIVRKETLPVQVDWFSTRQKRRILLRGLQGNVEYEGKIPFELLSVISAGELVNAGRFTTYGLGVFEVLFSN